MPACELLWLDDVARRMAQGRGRTLRGCDAAGCVSVGRHRQRVVVIVVSLIFFKTPVTTLNIIGTGLALSGVFAYSMAKRMTPDQDLKKSLEAVRARGGFGLYQSVVLA